MVSRLNTRADPGSLNLKRNVVDSILEYRQLGGASRRNQSLRLIIMIVRAMIVPMPVTRMIPIA